MRIKIGTKVNKVYKFFRFYEIILIPMTNTGGQLGPPVIFQVQYK